MKPPCEFARDYSAQVGALGRTVCALAGISSDVSTHRTVLRMCGSSTKRKPDRTRRDGTERDGTKRDGTGRLTAFANAGDLAMAAN